MKFHELVAIENTGTEQSKETKQLPARYFLVVLVQIALIDIIFSLDSVITAVGLANQLWVMITAIVPVSDSDDDGCRLYWNIRQPTPYPESTGSELSNHDWYSSGRGRSGLSYPEGLHLFRYGFLISR